MSVGELTRGQSVFTTEDGQEVIGMDLKSAKAYLLEKVRVTQMTAKNNGKAIATIQKARSTTQLSQFVYSWMLAHPSEGLRVI